MLGFYGSTIYIIGDELLLFPLMNVYASMKSEMQNIKIAGV